MRVFRVRCPAKINRFLSVGPPQSNGYHPIRTEFQSIGLSDEMEVWTSESATEDVVCFDQRDIPPQNTVSKTLRLAREYVNFPKLCVTVHKRIPSRAGLGGGSSDAAGLLRALKILTHGALDDGSAKEIAQGVGADVPFFLVGGRARGEGYGETLTPLPDPASRWVVIAKGSWEGTSTAEAYAQLDAIDREWAPFPEEDTAYNDFERVASEHVARIIDSFRAGGAVFTGLSGSGDAVFAEFEDESAAREALTSVAHEGYRPVFLTQTLSREESLWTS